MRMTSERPAVFRKVLCVRASRTAGGRRPQPFDHLENRRVVVHRMRHSTVLGPRRDDQTWNAETAQPIGVAKRTLGLGDWSGRWWHVIEEPAPFVVVDHQHGLVPG